MLLNPKKYLPFKLLLLFFIVIFVSSCTERRYKILSNKNASLYSFTVEEIVRMARMDGIAGRLTIRYEREKTVEDNFKALINKEVDFIITQNDVSFHLLKNKEHGSADDDIRVATPLFAELLYVIYPDSIEASSLKELLEGRRVNLGLGERSAKKIMKDLMEHLKVDTTKVTFVRTTLFEKNVALRPTIMCYFTSYVDPLMDTLLRNNPNLKIFTFDSPDVLLENSRVAGFTMRYMPAYPFVIPTGSYGKTPEEPVVTMAVDAVLLTRKDVSKYLVHDLVRSIHRYRSESSLLSTIDDVGVGSNWLYYALHPGSSDYYNQDTPTLLERYSRPLASIASVLIAGTAAFVRWRSGRVYRRIRKYYIRAIELEKTLSDRWQDAQYLSDVLDEMLKMKEEVYELLAKGKIHANDDFNVFQEMVNDLSLLITLNRNALAANDGLSPKTPEKTPEA